MPTYPHENPENGYALRIGKNLPSDAANLAYVHTDTPEPDKNILIDDYSSNIPENSLIPGQQEIYDAFLNENGRLETLNGPLLLTRPDVLLTEEYTVDKKESPLYYQSRSRKLFDARNALLSIPLYGKQTTKPKRFEMYNEDESYRFIYTGAAIKITKAGGMPLDQKDAIKVLLEKEGNDPFTYRIVVYSNFQNGTNGYEIHYPAYENGKSQLRTEILNPTPIFTEQSENTALNTDHTYRIEANDKGQYQISVRQNTTEEQLITPEERPPHTFQYQIEAEVQTRFSDKNPATIRIGLIYINDTIFNAVKVTTALKKLVHNNPLMPEYLTFENPHRLSGYHDKNDSTYWLTDLNMPKEHYLDYDILIISGYGDKDFTNSAESIRQFLNTGGTLILDNLGTGSSVLNTTTQDGVQTFVADIGFSQTKLATTPRQFTSHAVMKDRYYDITTPYEMGQVSPIIEWNGKENLADWTVYLEHQIGVPSLMQKNTGSIGKLIVSNMGLMLDVLYNNETTIRFLINTILEISEKRSFITPVFNEQVYHRDDLFPIEYKTIDGKQVYVDDQNDEDDTQIVAKKILSDHISDFARPYLPETYRAYQSAVFRTNVADNGTISIENADMEQSNASGEMLWEQTELNAVPGFDLIKFSGNTIQGSHTREVVKSGNYALKLKTTDTRGFWEQEVGVLAPGSYEAEVFVRSESAGGGGLGIYQSDGSLIAESSNLTGTSNWTSVRVVFELEESTEVLIRLGAHKQAATTTLYFDELSLSSQGVVRMTPTTGGGDPLYAYAIAPKGTNYQLTQIKTNQEAGEVIRVDHVAEGTLVVKSFVYQWYSAEGRYKKEYGNQKNTRFTIRNSENEKVLGNLVTFLPALLSGAEWAKKDRVYYELTFLGDNPMLELSVYDPMIQHFYFTPEGEWVINHDDLWWNGYDTTVQVRVENHATSLKASKYLYTVELKEENQIKVLYPSTVDERDRWYLQIQNGSFQKEAISASDTEQVASAGRGNFYNEFLSGTHVYQLPEYQRQTFYPVTGQRLVEDESAEYLDEYTIKVQRTPLIITEERVEQEVLEPQDDQHLVWKGTHIFWTKSDLPQIYLDEHQDGSPTLLTDGYTIDFDEGLVILEEPLNGRLLASYSHDNFRIKQRKYRNERIKGEQLRSRDNYTFESNHANWMISPAPVFYLETKTPEARIHPTRYAIDYQTGTVRFFQETRSYIFADYSYYEEKEIAYADANRFTGEIKLPQRHSFKDELVVSYLTENNQVEYKGYYDEETEHFVHLDLNPTAGHTFTGRTDEDGTTKWIEQAGEKLLGKEIYLYLLPYKSVYYKTERINPHTLRHVFGQDQWLKVKAANPEALLLSRIQVRENTAVHEAVVLDARRSGGGLKESVSQESIERRVGYTSAFWDIGSFDGLAYYRNGVTIVRVPEKVLDVHGGHFSEENIRNILDRYMAYGVYPIIEYTEEEKRGV